MKYLISALLVLTVFSCKTSSYANFKTKSLKSKFKRINAVYIQKYPVSSLTETSTVNTTPLAKDTNGSDIDYEVYFLENNYYQDLITQKYYNEHQDEANVPKDVFIAFKDSVEKIYPKELTFKEINILSDTIIKFKKKVIENEDNVYSSYEYYTLANIIQPNYFYVISWYGKGSSKYYEFGVSHRDYQNIDHWLEIKINEKREIIYWKEIDMKLFIKNEYSQIKNL